MMVASGSGRRCSITLRVKKANSYQFFTVQAAELAEAGSVQSTGTKAGLFLEAMKWVGCGDWLG